MSYKKFINFKNKKTLVVFVSSVALAATFGAILSTSLSNQQKPEQARASNDLSTQTAVSGLFSRRNAVEEYSTLDFYFDPAQGGSTAPIWSDSSAASTVNLNLRNLQVVDDENLEETYRCSYIGAKYLVAADAEANYINLNTSLQGATPVNYSNASGCGEVSLTHAQRVAKGDDLNWEFKVVLTRASDNKEFVYKDSYIYTVLGLFQ
jgi:hypothetical protein